MDDETKEMVLLLSSRAFMRCGRRRFIFSRGAVRVLGCPWPPVQLMMLAFVENGDTFC